MMVTADVTVVIPAFNAALTVPRALASVAAQTQQPREVLVIDDASTDDTVSVVSGELKRYPTLPIRLIRHPENRGPGAARNTGWGEARGHFIAFLDADDAWHPRKIELQYRWMLDHPNVALCGHGSALATQPISDDPEAQEMIGYRVRPWQMFMSNRFLTRAVMLRRDLPFRFQPAKKHAEDYLLWLQVILHGLEAWRLAPTLAYSYRPEFSPGGLSGKLWIHERGELDTLRTVWRERLISTAVFTLAAIWSLAKFARRFVLVRSMGRRRASSPT